MKSRQPLRALVLTACVVAVTALTSCSPIFGVGFDYPSEPPVPPEGTVVAEAKGWDDDDPMRGREVVIDMGSAQEADLLDFYRERFPTAEGWVEGTAAPEDADWHLLCLVSHADDDFDEYVEIFPYDRDMYGRDFKSAAPGRYKVSISRLYAKSEEGKRTANRCGLASIWFPIDL